MSFSHVLISQTNNQGRVVGSPQTFTGEGEANLDAVIPAESVDAQVAWSVDVSQIQSMILEASADMTLETNAIDATGGNTLNLLAGVPYVWHTGSYFTNVFALDITVLYVTSTAGGTLKGLTLLDATV